MKLPLSSLISWDLLILTQLILAESQSILAAEPNFYESKVVKYDNHCEVIFNGLVQRYHGLDENSPIIVKKGKLGHIEKGSELIASLNYDLFTITTIHEANVNQELAKVCGSLPIISINGNDSNKIVGDNSPSLLPKMNKTATEVRKLLSNGDPKNRIDVVFMGDGYQLSEKQKFFTDIDYLVKKLFEGETFNSYFPIYNVWAVFVESQDSGITKGNIKKNTAFSLYRPGEELRAIYYPNDSISKVNSYCKLTGDFACDYKVVIANDEYYGGVGGDIIISTSSKRSGSIVLNHEMGHTFAEVGDEYDNSYAYYGANSEEVQNFNSIKWKHWLTSNTVREERNINRLLLYPWYSLKNGPFVTNFTSDGKFNRWYYRIGISGAAEEDSISIKIDDISIPWKSANTIDRVFYDHFNSTNGFSKGLHTLNITSTKDILDNMPLRMVTSVTLHEYGTEQEYKFEGENYSLYPTWDDHNVKRYRPTNEHCVMRNMTSSKFCKVCKESLWLQYLKRLNIIDDLTVSKMNSNIIVNLTPLAFGPFRKDPELFKGEKFIIKWYKNNVQLSQFNDQFKLSLSNINSYYSGNWTVKVQLITPEVKKDDTRLLFSEKKFVI